MVGLNAFTVRTPSSMKRRPEQVNVRARGDQGAPDQHLRRHVGRRPREVVRRRRIGADREPPVDQIDRPKIADHNVVELDVAVDDAVPMRELHGVADLAEDLEVLPEPVAARGPRRVAHERAPRHALDALHDEDRLAVLAPAEQMNGDDVGVIERAREPRFSEQCPHRGVAKAVGLHALHRDDAIKDGLTTEIDAPHAAPAELAGDDDVRSPRARGSQRVRRDEDRKIRDDLGPHRRRARGR